MLAETVYTAEIIPELGNAAKDRLKELDYKNVEVMVDDGSAGFVEHAPYDAVIVTAGAPQVPQELLYQLNVGGRMVVPVRGDSAFLPGEKLLRLTRTAEVNSPTSFSVEYIDDVRFVPLRGKAGWKDL